MSPAPARILIDARYLWREPSGIGRYSENVIAALRKLDSINEYTILTREGYVPPPGASPNFNYLSLPHAPVSAATLLRLGSWINRRAFDLVHIHCPVIPPGVRAPLIVTFHDWLPLMDPRFTGHRPAPMKLAYDLFYRWHYPYAVRKAARVIANSETTRSYILRDVPEAENKIRVNLFGIAETFFSPPDPEFSRRLIQTENIPARYFLYVGSTRPNKEVPTMLRAFAALGEQAPAASDVGLVMCLSRDRFFPAVEALMRELNLSSRVKILWNAGDETLKALYAGCMGLVLPSVAEGFGFPAAEAMAQGAPVVISTDGSPQEIAGDAALRVPPRDAAALASAMGRLAGDEALRSELSRIGRARARRFDWLETGKRELNIYREMITDLGTGGGAKMGA